MLQAGGRLADVIARPAHRQRALAADHLGQVGAGDEFHHQEMPLAGGFRVVDRHHVGMIEAGGGAGLAHEAIHGRGIGQQLGVDRPSAPRAAARRDARRSRPCPSPRNPTAAARDSGDDRPGRPAPTPGSRGPRERPGRSAGRGRGTAASRARWPAARPAAADTPAPAPATRGARRFAPVRRRARRPGLPPATTAPRIARPPRTARTPGRSAAGSPRKGRDRSADRAPGMFPRP